MNNKITVKEQSSKTKEDKIMTYKYYYGKWLKNGYIVEKKNGK